MLLDGLAFVIFGLQRISFDITRHRKKNIKLMLFLLKYIADLVVQLISPYCIRPVKY